MLCDRHGWLHVSSGEVLRRTAAEESQIGHQIKDILESGNLVPDTLINRIMMTYITETARTGSVLLDGFPRTPAQAASLDAELETEGRSISVALLLDADVEQLVTRMRGRLTCRKCKAVYHTEYHPPKVAGVCDRCGGELYRRSDDDEATVRYRMDVYKRETQPLVNYYRDRGILQVVNGEQPIDDVYRELDAIVLEAVH
jgi:adenylate kinase